MPPSPYEPKPGIPVKRTFKTLRAGAIREDDLRKQMRERGFFSPEIIGDWPYIAGSELSSCTAPLRMMTRPLPGGGVTMTLYVALFRAPMAMALQMAEPVILERLATYLGHRCADKLVIKHFFDAPYKAPLKKRSRRRKQPATLQHASAVLQEIDDDRLRNILSRLAETLYNDTIN